MENLHLDGFFLKILRRYNSKTFPDRNGTTELHN